MAHPVLLGGVSSQRVLTGSLTKGSTAIDVTPNESTTDGFRDGVYLRDYHDVYNHVRQQIRPNTSDIISLGGKTLSEVAFDDQMASGGGFELTISGTGGTTDVDGGAVAKGPYMRHFGGRYKSQLNHQIEQRDLGQTELYDDGLAFYETTNPEDPVAIISMHPLLLELPASFVDHSSVSALDGKLEPLDVRSSIDRSTIDHPFDARGVKTSVGVGTDAFLRSFFIEDGSALPGKESTIEPFLDSVSTMGDATLSDYDVSGSTIDIPGAFYEGVTKISPFKDAANDIERFYDNYGSSISNDIRGVIISGATFKNVFLNDDIGSFHPPRSDARLFDRHATRGFDHDNGIGIDSIVFGGLKK